MTMTLTVASSLNCRKSFLEVVRAVLLILAPIAWSSNSWAIVETYVEEGTDTLILLDNEVGDGWKAAVLVKSCSNGGIDDVQPWRYSDDRQSIQLGMLDGTIKLFPVSAIQTKALPDGEWLCGKFDQNAQPSPQDRAKGLS